LLFCAYTGGNFQRGSALDSAGQHCRSSYVIGRFVERSRQRYGAQSFRRKTPYIQGITGGTDQTSGGCSLC
jgi:hypothetical protein